MESSYFEIWLSIKAREFFNSSIQAASASSLDEDIMTFLDSNPGLVETFSRELKFSNVFEGLKKKITESL
jgi:hypothetical protein